MAKVVAESLASKWILAGHSHDYTFELYQANEQGCYLKVKEIAFNPTKK
ncbi:MAG: hypothetical protein ACRC3Z_06325 [Phocaeicola sp.]